MDQGAQVDQRGLSSPCRLFLEVLEVLQIERDQRVHISMGMEYIYVQCVYAHRMWRVSGGARFLSMLAACYSTYICILDVRMNLCISVFLRPVLLHWCLQS